MAEKFAPQMPTIRSRRRSRREKRFIGLVGGSGWWAGEILAYPTDQPDLPTRPSYPPKGLMKNRISVTSST
jgi:hypothetical protein